MYDYNKAWSHFVDKRYEEALICLEDFDKDSINCKNSIDMIHDIALNMNDYEKALDLLRTVPEDNKHYAFAQYYIGNVYFQKKEYEKAIEHFSHVPESNSYYKNSINMIYNIANIMNDYEKGLDLLKKVTEDNEDYGMVQYYIGSVYYSKKEYEKAVEYFNKTPKENQYYQHSQNSIKNIYLTFLNEGRNYFIEGDYKKAVELLNKIPEGNEHYKRAMELIEKSNLEGKIKVISLGISEQLSDKADELQKASDRYKVLFVLLILAGIGASIWLLNLSLNENIDITKLIKITSTGFVILGLILWLARFVNRRIHETTCLKEEYAHKAIVLSSVIPYANMINSLSKEKPEALLDFIERVSININKSPVSSVNKIKNDNIPINDLTGLVNAINALKK